MTIKDLFAVCGNRNLIVLIRDTDGIVHTRYECVQDIEDTYTHCNVTEWYVVHYDGRTNIVVTVDANNFDR